MKNKCWIVFPALYWFMAAAGSAHVLLPHDRVLSDTELNDLRAGVMLPDGLAVDIGIDVQTEVNGVLVLHTVLSTAAPPADQLRVFSGGPTPASSQATSVSLSPVPPSLNLDRSGSSTTLSVSTAPLNPSVEVVNAPTNTWPLYSNENRVFPATNGPAVATGHGAVQVQQSGGQTSVTLQSPGLTVQQLFGNATGVLVANQLNNQVIQSSTTVDVSLQGAWPAIANTMFGVGNIAIVNARRP